MTIQELLEKRAALVAEARKYNDEHSGDWNEERQNKYDAMMADVDKLAGEVRRLEDLQKAEDFDKESRGRIVDPPAPEVRDSNPASPTATPEYRNAWMNWVRTGNGTDLRSLNISTDPQGGYLAPDEFVRKMIVGLNDHVELRNYATVIQTASDQNIPVSNQDAAAYWTGEEKEYTETNATFAMKHLGAHKETALIRVSEELLQDSVFDISSFISGEFVRAFGDLEEPAFTTGNNIGRPDGFTNDAETGVTAAQATILDADELIDLFYSLRAPYRRRAIWMMKDATVAKVRKLKDEAGNYIWLPTMMAGQPDSILGRPVVTNESMPAATANSKAIAFGDFSFYWIADRTAMALQRLNEKYAEYGQIGFRAFKRTDGRLTRTEAIKMLVMGAADGS